MAAPTALSRMLDDIHEREEVEYVPVDERGLDDEQIQYSRYVDEAKGPVAKQIAIKEMREENRKSGKAQANIDGSIAQLIRELQELDNDAHANAPYLVSPIILHSYWNDPAALERLKLRALDPENLDAQRLWRDVKAVLIDGVPNRNPRAAHRYPDVFPDLATEGSK